MADPKQLQISLPGAGKTQTYQLTADTPVHFNFDISEAEFTGQDGNLEIALEGGGTVILEGYQALAESGTLPSFQMMDGEVVAGDVYLFAFADQGDQTDLETAADGNASGSGAGAYNDDPGALFAGINALGGQGDAYDPHLFPAGVDTPENDPPVANPDFGEVVEQGEVDFNPGLHIITTTEFTVTDAGSEEAYGDYVTLTPQGGDGHWFGFFQGNLGISGSDEEGGDQEPSYPSDENLRSSQEFPLPQETQDNPLIDNEDGTESVLIDFSIPQTEVQIVLGGFNGFGDFGRDDASLIVETLDGTYTIGLDNNTQTGVLYDMNGDEVGTVQVGFGGVITVNLALGGELIDNVTVSSEAAWPDPSSNDFFIKSVSGVMPEPPAAWTGDPNWDPTDWGLPEGAEPTFANYLQYLYPEVEGANAQFEAFMGDFGDDYFPLTGEGPGGFFITYPEGAHSDVISSGNLLLNDYDVDNLQESLRMFSIDYVGKLDDVDPDDGADDGEIGTGVNPDGSLILGPNEGPFSDFDQDPDPTAYHEIAGKYGTLLINALGDYQYVLDPDLADHLEEGQIELEQFEYSIVDPQGAESNTSTLTITVYGTNDAPVAVPDFNEAIEQGDSEAYTDPITGGEVVSGDLDLVDGNGLVEASDGGYGERIVYSYNENNGSYEDGNGTYTAAQQVEYLDEHDDANTVIDITGVFANGVNINGTNYTSVSVNTNGTLVFGDGYSVYSPSASALEDSDNPMIAGMWDDLDPGNGGEMYMDVDAANGIITFTWLDIAPNGSGTLEEGGDYQNSMQIRLYDLGNGDFGVEIRYADISWVNSNATGDNSVPIGGWSNGDGDFGLVDGSHTAAFLDVESTSNIDHPGVWAWIVRDGEFGDMIEGNGLLHDFTNVTPAEGNVLTDLYDYDGSDDGSALDLDHDGDVEGDAITVVGIYSHGTQQQETFDFHRVDAEGNPVTDGFGPDEGVDTVVDDNGDFMRIWGEYGVLEIYANGDYTYTPRGEAADALNYDDSPIERFTYMIVDEHGAIDYANLSIRVHGANDAPEAFNDYNWIREDGEFRHPGMDSSEIPNEIHGNILTGHDFLGRSDSDVDDDITADGVRVYSVNGAEDSDSFAASWDEGDALPAPLEVQGEYGTLFINADGSYTYVLDDTNEDVQALNVIDGIPQLLHETFTYTTTNHWDDGVFSNEAKLVITIKGSNDAPVLYDNTPTSAMVDVTADDFAGAQYQQSIYMDELGMTFTAQSTNGHGLLSVADNGDLLGVVNRPGEDPAIDDWDPNNRSADSIRIDFDLPQDAVDIELGRFNDHFGDGDFAKATMYDYEGNEIGFAILHPGSGEDTFHLDPASDLIAYVVVEAVGGWQSEFYIDSVSASAPGDYNLNTHAVEAGSTNDLPMDAQGDSDAVSVAGNVLADPDAQGNIDSDVDNIDYTDGSSDPVQLNVVGIALGADQGFGHTQWLGNDGMHQIQGTYGTLFIKADGTYVYTLDPEATDSLNDGDTATESFTYVATDDWEHGNNGFGSMDGYRTANLVITIDGTNDAPIAHADHNLLIESVGGSNFDVDTTALAGHLANGVWVDPNFTITAGTAHNHAGNVSFSGGGRDLTESGDEPGLGINSDNDINGTEVDTINGNDHWTEALSIDFTEPMASVTVTLSSLFNAESGIDGNYTETARLVAFDRFGNEIGSIDVNGSLSGEVTVTLDGASLGTDSLIYQVVVMPVDNNSDQNLFNNSDFLIQNVSGTTSATIAQVGGNVIDGAWNGHGRDTDVDNDRSELTVVDVEQEGSHGSAGELDGVSYDYVLQGEYGTLYLQANGDYTYVENPDATDPLNVHDIVNDVFTYTISDNQPGAELHDISTLTITVFGSNDAPVASADSTHQLFQGYAFKTFSDWSGADGDAVHHFAGITVTALSSEGDATLENTSGDLGVHTDNDNNNDIDNSGPDEGVRIDFELLQDHVVLDLDGFYGDDNATIYLYDLEGDLIGTRSLSGYTNIVHLTDGLTGGEQFASIVIRTPGGYNDEFTINSISARVLSYGPDGDPSEDASQWHYSHGYVIEGDDVTGNVLLNDNDVDNGDWPDNPDQTIELSVSGIASDTVPGNAASYDDGVFTIDGKYGTLTIQANGRYFYEVDQDRLATEQLDDDFNGTEEFSYTIVDPGGLHSTAALTFNVVGANDAPVAFNDELGGAVSVFTTNFADADGLQVWAADGMTFTAMRNGEPNGWLEVRDDDNGMEPNGMVGVYGSPDGSPAIDGSGWTDSVLIDFDNPMSSVTISLSDFANSGGDHDDVTFVLKGVNGEILGTMNVENTDTHEFTFTTGDTGGAYIGSIEVMATDGSDDFYIDWVRGEGTTYLEDTTITLSAADILANDTDIDDVDMGDADYDGTNLDLSIHSVFGPHSGPYSSVGGWAEVVDGDVVFHPNQDFNGTASFWYVAEDDNGDVSNPAKVTLEIANVNDGPTANPDTDRVYEYDGQEANDLPLYPTATGNLITDNAPGDQGDYDNGKDTDPDNQDNNPWDPVAGPPTPDDQLSLVSVTYDGETKAFENGDVSFETAYGRITFSEDGSYTYQATEKSDVLNVGHDGQETFSYVMQDEAGAQSSSTLTIDVLGINDAATFTETDVVEATEDANVVNGMIQASGTVVADDVDSPETFQPMTQTDSYGGTFTINADGEWTYTVPNDAPARYDAIQSLDDGETLNLPGFTVTSADGTEYVVHPVVNGVNDAPVAADDAFGGPVSVFTTNFAAADGQQVWEADGMTFTAMRNGEPNGWLEVRDDDNGMESNGMVGVYGSPDGSPAIDGSGWTDSVLIDFDNPMSSVTISLSDFADSGGDHDDVTFVLKGVNGEILGTMNVEDTDTHEFTFTTGDTGGAYIGSIEVLATDSNDDFYIDWVRGDGIGYIEDGGPITLSAAEILANDYDVDIESFDIGKVYGDNDGQYAPEGGTATINSDGSVTFTPDADFNGTASFWYSAYDGTEYSVPAKVTIQIAPVNDGPTANPDTDRVYEYDGQESNNLPLYPTATGNLITDNAPGDQGDLDNGKDTDPDNQDNNPFDPVAGPPTPDDQLSLVSVTYDGETKDFENGDVSFETTYGRITFSEDGSYTYQATEKSDVLNVGHDGQETFSYVMQDEAGAQSGSTLTIDVLGINDAATFTETDVVEATEDANVVNGMIQASGTVVADDVDSPETFEPMTQTDSYGGTFSINADGEWTYTVPNDAPARYDAIQSLDDGETLNLPGFTVTSADGTEYVVHPVVNGVNDAPVAADDAFGYIPAQESIVTDVDHTAFSAANNWYSDGVTLTAGASGSNPILVDSGDGVGVQSGNDYSATQIDGKNDESVTISFDQGQHTATITLNWYDTDDTPTFVVYDTEGHVIDNADLTIAPPVINGPAVYDQETTYTYTVTAAGDQIGSIEVQADFYQLNPSGNWYDAADFVVQSVHAETEGAPEQFLYQEDGGPIDLAAADILANDYDVDIENFGIGKLYDDSDQAHAPVGGTVSMVGDVVTFTPDADFNGTASFWYSAYDGTEYSEPAKVTIQIAPTDDPVDAVDDGTDTGTGLFEVTEDGTAAQAVVSGNVITNDSAPDGWQTDSTTGDITAIDFNGADSNEPGYDFQVQGTYGTLYYNEDGTFRYELDNNDPDLDTLDGVTTETFGYTATDSDGSFDTANLIITVNGTSDNAGPTANPDNYNLDSGFNVVTEAGVNVIHGGSNYLIMLDRSRSMSDAHRIEPAEDAIVSMLQKLQSELPTGMEVKIGMVDFSDNASTTTFTLVGGNPGAPMGLNDAISHIDTGDTGTWTNYDAAFQQGYAWALAHPGATQAIFISDGDPTTDLSGVSWQDLSEDLGDLDGVDLTAVALGSAINMGNLNDINEDGPATVIPDDDPTALQTLLVQIVDESHTDLTTASGNVIYDTDNLPGEDIDPDNDPLEVVSIAHGSETKTLADPDTTDSDDTKSAVIEGDYGTLHIDEHGNYTYTPNQPAADALADGEHGVDTFTYTIEDPAGESSSTTVSFWINGSNDGVVAIGDMNHGAALTSSTTSGTEWVQHDGTEQLHLEIAKSMLVGEQTSINPAGSGITITGSSDQDFDLVWSGGGLGIKTDESSETTKWTDYFKYRSTETWDDADNGISNVTETNDTDIKYSNYGGWHNYSYTSEDHPEGLTIGFDAPQGTVVIGLNGVRSGEAVTAYAYNGNTLVATATASSGDSSLELVDPSYSRTDAQTLITSVILVGTTGTSYTLDSVTTYGPDTWSEEPLPPVTTYAGAPVTGFLQTNDYDVDTAGALSVALLDATGTWGNLSLDPTTLEYTYTPDVNGMNDSGNAPTGSFVETFTYEVTSPDGTTDVGTLYVPVHLNPSDTVSLGSGDDAYSSGATNDVIDGQAGTDSIHGGAGDDVIYGGEGNDILNGGTGDDVIFGDAGDDVIQASTGNDIIALGEGKDVVMVDVDYLAHNDGGVITIADFSDKDGDVLDLNNANGYTLNFQEVLDDASATGSHYLELTLTDNDGSTADVVIRLMGAHIAADAPSSGLFIDSNTIDDVIQQIIDSPDNN